MRIFLPPMPTFCWTSVGRRRPRRWLGTVPARIPCFCDTPWRCRRSIPLNCRRGWRNCGTVSRPAVCAATRFTYAKRPGSICICLGSRRPRCGSRSRIGRCKRNQRIFAYWSKSALAAHDAAQLRVRDGLARRQRHGRRAGPQIIVRGVETQLMAPSYTVLTKTDQRRLAADNQTFSGNFGPSLRRSPDITR